MSVFVWSKKKNAVAVALAEGQTQLKAASEQGVSPRTISRWLADTEFSAEVDRLSVMIAVACKAERLRIVNRIVRQKVREEIVETDKDLLDWLKFAQSETDGLNLGLTASLTDLVTSLAGGRQDGPHENGR